VSSTPKNTPANPQPTRRPIAYGMSGASEAVDVGPTKLREEIRQRRLRARKLGRKTIITAFDLEDWVARLPDIHDVAPIKVGVARATET
jgi:hypothetical protein